MKNKPEARKQTVTIVLGPSTVSLMNDLNAYLKTQSPMQPGQSLTDLAGACVNECLTEWRRKFLNEGMKTTVNHFD